MDSCGDERAVTVQVGAVILLAFVVIAIATYQAQVVPQQNSQVEYNHNQQVQTQLQEVRNSIVTAAVTGRATPQTVSLGTTYPSRTIFVNPGPPAGSLRTVGTQNASINVSVANGTAFDGEIDDYWDGTARNFSTGALVYQPNYNVYENGPTTVYENSLLYNVYRSANITVAGQGMVDGTEITLVALGGELQANSGGTETVDVTSLSTSENTVELTNQTGTNLTITFPTYLNQTQWQDVMGDEVDGTGNTGNDAYIHSVSYQPVPGQQFNLVTLEFEQDVTYQLDLARIGVGETSGVDRTNATYLTLVGDPQVSEGETGTVTFEVRDQYDNPVSGVPVNASASSGTITSSNPQTTGSNGHVSFSYQAPSDVDGSDNTDTVNASFTVNTSTTSIDPDAPENVSATVEIRNSDGSGGGGAGNYDMMWDFDYIESQNTYTQCYAANETCVYNISQTTNDNLDMRVNTTPPTSEVFVDFGHNDSTIVKAFNPSEGATDGSGYRTTTLSFENGDPTGTLRLLASAVEDPETMTLKVIGGGGGGGTNNPPVADAGGPYAVDEGNSTTLDGSASSDSDGSISTYDWQVISGSGSISNTDNTTPTATYNAPANVGSDTDMTVQLTVTDDNGSTSTDTTTVTVRDTGGSGDSTAPTVGSASAEAQDTSGSKQDVEQVTFTYQTSDNVAVDNVTLRVLDSSGTELNSSISQQASDTVVVGIPATALNGNRYITVEMVVQDTSGNSRTCTGRIDNVGQQITKSGGGLDCSTTATANVRFGYNYVDSWIAARYADLK
ncbi:PKD domain-containing protein [Haloarchaeobius sp. TZWSO28]|uniref:Ig-like domain-containing protein n=1 Tax=Haloarchaeobius sp. TZWSO28 TaxID=3446119 RepID=UPI003EBE6032